MCGSSVFTARPGRTLRSGRSLRSCRALASLRALRAYVPLRPDPAEDEHGEDGSEKPAKPDDAGHQRSGDATCGPLMPARGEHRRLVSAVVRIGDLPARTGRVRERHRVGGMSDVRPGARRAAFRAVRRRHGRQVVARRVRLCAGRRWPRTVGRRRGACLIDERGCHDRSLSVRPNGSPVQPVRRVAEPEPERSQLPDPDDRPRTGARSGATQRSGGPQCRPCGPSTGGTATVHYGSRPRRGMT